MIATRVRFSFFMLIPLALHSLKPINKTFKLIHDSSKAIHLSLLSTRCGRKAPGQLFLLQINYAHFCLNLRCIRARERSFSQHLKWIYWGFQLAFAMYLLSLPSSHQRVTVEADVPSLFAAHMSLHEIYCLDGESTFWSAQKVCGGKITASTSSSWGSYTRARKNPI